MASETDEQELVRKLHALQVAEHGDDTARMFAAYDRDHDSRLNASELGKLLEAADVGNGLTRDSWVYGILARVDKDRDDAVSLAEVEGIMGVQPMGPPVPEDPEPMGPPPPPPPVPMGPPRPPKATQKRAATDPSSGSSPLGLALLIGLVACVLLTRLR